MDCCRSDAGVEGDSVVEVTQLSTHDIRKARVLPRRSERVAIRRKERSRNFCNCKTPFFRADRLAARSSSSKHKTSGRHMAGRLKNEKAKFPLTLVGNLPSIRPKMRKILEENSEIRKKKEAKNRF